MNISEFFVTLHSCRGLAICSFFLFRDENLLDSIIPAPTVRTDALIDIAKVQWAAQKLHDETKFLNNFQILHDQILVVRKSVNELFAGPGRTIADLFDLTGERLPTIN